MSTINQEIQRPAQDEAEGAATRERRWPAPPISAGLAGRCPRCGEASMFDGLLTIKPRCEVCGLDYAFADSADGPAVFVMLTTGFAAVGLALFIEAMWEPPFWVHLVVTLPLCALICLATLRPLKALLVFLQYRNKAEQGRLAR
jgi:uncharacterized protein (DUF983 family)